jgi:hypothetical protein
MIQPDPMQRKVGAHERSPTAMNTIQRYFAVNHQDMAYLKFIVESYEGLAVIRTVDRAKGIMEWMIPPDRVAEVEALVNSLKEEISIVPANPPDGISFSSS